MSKLNFEPEDEEEIEDDLLPAARPPYGAYLGPMEFLHAARLALDSQLAEPARLLARETMERARKAAAAQRERFSPEEEEKARVVGEPRSDDANMDLLDDLAFLAAAIEKRVKMPH